MGGCRGERVRRWESGRVRGRESGEVKSKREGEEGRAGNTRYARVPGGGHGLSITRGCLGAVDLALF